jgi:hypothetical protein
VSSLRRSWLVGVGCERACVGLFGDAGVVIAVMVARSGLVESLQLFVFFDHGAVFPGIIPIPAISRFASHSNLHGLDGFSRLNAFARPQCPASLAGLGILSSCVLCRRSIHTPFTELTRQLLATVIPFRLVGGVLGCELQALML